MSEQSDFKEQSIPRYRFTPYTGYPYKTDLYICHEWVDGHGYCYLPGFYKKEHVDKIIALRRELRALLAENEDAS